MPQPKPLPAAEAAVAVPATFEDDVTDQGDLNVFEPDVSKWPARAAQMQALKAIASEKSLLAQTAISQADELKAVVDDKNEKMDVKANSGAVDSVIKAQKQ